MNIQSNSFIKEQNLKIYICMAILTFMLGSLGAALSYRFHWGLTGTGSFLLLAALINFLSYFFSHRLILSMSRAKPLKRNQVPELFTMVENLCHKQNLPMPKIYLINDDSMNAFATGRDKKHAVVAVTKGLLEKLEPSEVKAVVAHELTHIQNGDMRLMTAVTMIAGFISIVADMYWCSTRASKAEDRDRSGALAIIGFVLALLAPLSALFIQLAISRKREFVADAGSAQMTTEPLALVSALRKLSKDLIPLPSAGITTAHLYFSSPAKAGDWLDKMFSTHPPIEERIKFLEKIR